MHGAWLCFYVYNFATLVPFALPGGKEVQCNATCQMLETCVQMHLICQTRRKDRAGTFPSLTSSASLDAK